VESGLTQVAELLLSRGADVNCVNLVSIYMYNMCIPISTALAMFTFSKIFKILTYFCCYELSRLTIVRWAYVVHAFNKTFAVTT